MQKQQEQVEQRLEQHLQCYKAIPLDKPNLYAMIGEPKKIKLLVNGQGVFIFKIDNEINNENAISSSSSSICNFFLYNKDGTDGLNIQFTRQNVIVSRISTPGTCPFIDPNNNCGLSSIKGAYYWFSLDAQNQRLYAGVGEARLETMTYKYSFTHKEKFFLESLVEVCIAQESKSLAPVRLLRDPITSTIPLLVKNTDDLTMTDVASGNYLPKANLSAASQKMYDCISGKKFILDDDDFPEFTKAIEYSIATPGKWCNTKLKDKSTEFNKDKPNILETYLRITLGENNGESPGIPYVMEIWPVGHFSPIHNHAGANAIVRVLYGKINVRLFPFLSAEKTPIKPFNEAVFKKDEVTWISEKLNQTHQLINKDTNTQTCITIQCYMYDNENTTHYDYFDYLDEKGDVLQYEPDSDMDFITFKNLMREEWEELINYINDGHVFF